MCQVLNVLNPERSFSFLPGTPKGRRLCCSADRELQAPAPIFIHRTRCDAIEGSNPKRHCFWKMEDRHRPTARQVRLREGFSLPPGKALESFVFLALSLKLFSLCSF